MCGQTMFKTAGKGAHKPFCINEQCANFTPEEKRGGYRRKSADGDAGDGKPAEKKSAAKKATAKKSVTKKNTAKTAAKKAAAKK